MEKEKGLAVHDARYRLMAGENARSWLAGFPLVPRCLCQIQSGAVVIAIFAHWQRTAEVVVTAGRNSWTALRTVCVVAPSPTPDSPFNPSFREWRLVASYAIRPSARFSGPS